MIETTARDRIVGLYSFPKSGNTWLRAIIAGITGMPGGPGMLQRYVTDSHYGPVIVNPWEFQDRNWYFYKSHRKDVLTEHAGQVFDTDRILYMYRHPLDVFLSYLNFVSGNVAAKVGENLPVRFERVEELTPDQMETLFAIFLEHATLFPENRAFGGLFEHVANFRRLAESQGNVLILRYEDLYDDFDAEVRRICDFLELENVNVQRAFRVADRRTQRNGKFFWKRKKGNFRDYLTEDQISRFGRAHAGDMAALGYPVE